ncbi:hypothetical protein CRUP_026340 [Coryphaenoides rupestris]|nr:hypothetical protein CRUP_026340 [Coryphaenoides rupestris]
MSEHFWESTMRASNTSKSVFFTWIRLLTVPSWLLLKEPERNTSLPSPVQRNTVGRILGRSPSLVPRLSRRWALSPWAPTALSLLVFPILLLRDAQTAHCFRGTRR